MVSKPIYMGGLGFGMKWMMGWMHDTLEYFQKDPIYRKHHQNDITFSMTYAFTENFLLPLSHDEVVHGKKSILGKMPGDEWQRFANLRLLYGYMFSHPGSKLLFMGGEFGQSSEWNFDESLDWHLLEFGYHKGIQSVIKDLNKLYQQQPALHEKQFNVEGFEWISYDDSQNSIISFIRKGIDPKDELIVVCNFTPIPLENYKLGMPRNGKLVELFNSDNEKYSGSGVGNSTPIPIKQEPSHHRKFSAMLVVPPLSVVVFKIL
jgi:1,4-alpha-glucan branching enzyme